MLPDFKLCCSLFSKYGLTLTPKQFQLFNTYAQFLVEYNNNVNLTAITDPYEILVKHFLDSAVVLRYSDIPYGASIIDVGTGAGFPSVPLRIMRPDLKIVLLDSLAKRVDFLRQLCELLGIQAEFIHGRAEEFGKMAEYREKFDFSTARAVANMSLLLEFCIPFVRKGGFFLALKGPNEQISSSENAVSILGGATPRIIDYEIGSEKRRIVVVKKLSQTPTKYPRNSAQIKKNPL